MKSSFDMIRKNILVIGDVMLDTYYEGEVSRISPEAPVPVFLKKSEKSVLGGAANVASNLIAANQNVFIMSIIGNDETGIRFRDICHSRGIDTDLIISLERSTTEKIRLLANHYQQVIRMDIEDLYSINHTECEQFMHMLSNKIDQFDLIVISDYLKGLLTEEFTQKIILLANKKNIPVIIDVKDKNFSKYKYAYLLKPNRKELQTLTGLPVETDDEVIFAANALKKMCECQYVLTTCGSRGMVLVGEDTPYFIDAVGKEVYDVTGAGDTTIAYLAACIANGWDILKAVDIANYAAGIQVSKVGTSAVYWHEINEFIGILHRNPQCKCLDKENLALFREEHSEKKIVFTNGCFDILHIGHVRYLQKAAQLGDILVVGLNSDESVKRLKGAERPINSELDRIEMLSVLGFVDYVVVFDEDTPYDLIEKIRPDILVKGGDYKPDEVVGRDIVEANGGELVIMPLVEGKSTSNIIQKLHL